MKTFKILMLAAAGCFALASCSDDDDATAETNADLVGTYNMTAWNTPVATDFDGDGTTSLNMMDESDCFNNSKMVVNSNGTYTLTYNAIGITGTTANCAASQTTTGTWERSGNTFTTTSTAGSIDTDTDYTFAKGTGTSGNTMTRTMANAQYATVNDADEASWSTGTVTTIMTKQ